MSKKIFLLISSLCLCCLFAITGCSLNVEELAKQSISEKVEVYFSGTGDFSANISSGYREDPYVYNGKTAEVKNFAVVTLLLGVDSKYVQADITINDKTSTILLEQDMLSSEHVADLGYKVKEDDEISIKYKDKSVQLTCKSKDFATSSDRALEIGTTAFAEDLEKLISKEKLSAECYLRVIDNPNDKFNRLFWYFYIYAENGTTHYCVISVEDDNILIKS